MKRTFKYGKFSHEIYALVIFDRKGENFFRRSGVFNERTKAFKPTFPKKQYENEKEFNAAISHYANQPDWIEVK